MERILANGRALANDRVLLIPAMENQLEVKRLGWAGIQLECEGFRIVIDLFEERHSFAPLFDEITGELPAPSGPVDAALVTHLHADHTDPVAIGRSLKTGGLVLRPAPAIGDDLDRAATMRAEAGLAELDARVETVSEWQSTEIGPFTATAVPAVDGFGDPQVSWVVEAAGRRIFHGGDTLYHGFWWPITSRFGSFDAVFLPINGAICNFPHRQPPSPLPATLDPKAAAAAAQLLRAKVAVPIHFDGIDEPGLYKPVDDAAAKFVYAANHAGVQTKVLAVGESLGWQPAAVA